MSEAATLIRDGLAHHARGELAEAEAAYRAALARDPSNADGLHLLGVVAHATGHMDDAVGLINQAIERAPDRAAYHSNLGNVHLSQGQPAKAEEALRRALELDANMAAAHNNMGLAMSAQGRFAEAADCYRAVIRLQPSLAEAHGNLAGVLIDQGRLEEAEAAVRQGLEAVPDNLDLAARLVQVLVQRGRAAEAAALAEERLAAQPDFSPLLLACGLARLELGQPIRAQDCFLRAGRGSVKLVESADLRRKAEARQPSDFTLLEQIMTAEAKGLAEMEVDIEIFRMPHSPLKIEHFASQALVAIVAICGLAAYTLPLYWAMGVSAATILAYVFHGRKIVGAKMKSYAIAKMKADLTLWLYAWREGAVTLRLASDGVSVTGPDGNWRVVAEDCGIALATQSPA